MRGRPALVSLVALLTLGSGLLSLFLLVSPGLPARTGLLLEVFPLEFLHLSRLLTVLLGFALIISSVHLYRRKRRAFIAVVCLSVVSATLHLTKGLVRGIDLEQGVYSLLLLPLLFATRRSFTVGSGVPRWRSEGTGLLLASALAFAYGVAGFWFLDAREFGINFTLWASIHRTARYLSLVADPQITPHTRHAVWFVDSLRLTTVALIGYALTVLFRPVLYQHRTLPRERAIAAEVVRKHGRSALDYFKVWPDKSYFFSPQRNAFIAFGVAGSFAVVLGDPVGPEDQIPDLVRSFLDFCRDNDWGVAFYQTAPDFLPVYRSVGLKKLKIGDDAVVDLTQFNLDGKDRKGMRHKVNQLDAAGVRLRVVDPPAPVETLAQIKEVSDAWLSIPGRRERGFTLGLFDRDYLRTTPLVLVEDAEERLLAFANLIPSYAPGETTIDLMRHRPDAPNGIMDYLFIKLFLLQRGRGFTRFNLGLAPMAGFQEHEQAGAEERAVHVFFQNLNFLFSYQGLRQYKAKFASSWEPRHVIFRRVLDLPRLALALGKVSEVKEKA
jgi:phosphatidylglycerol lysyltransferase